MNVFAPISSIMTGHHQLVTVAPEDNLLKVKELFAKHTFHHIPVVRYRDIVGIISRTDFDHFIGGLSNYADDQFLNDSRMRGTTAQNIMTTRLAKVEASDRINVALDIFILNRFHALPVIEEGELVGILTPFDIMKALAGERPADPTSIYAS